MTKKIKQKRNILNRFALNVHMYTSDCTPVLNDNLRFHHKTKVPTSIYPIPHYPSLPPHNHTPRVSVPVIFFWVLRPSV